MTKYQKFEEALINGKNIEFLSSNNETILKFIPIPSIDGDIVLIHGYDPKQRFYFYEYTKGVHILDRIPLLEIKDGYFNHFNPYREKIILKISNKIVEEECGANLDLNIFTMKFGKMDVSTGEHFDKVYEEYNELDEAFKIYDYKEA